MKALVTGATGFIGSVIVRELIRHGTHVRALVLPGESAVDLEKNDVEVVRSDLCLRNSINGVCDGIDVVYHLAGRVTDWGTREQFYSAIYDATLNLLNESSGKGLRFVYVSSIAAMGFGRHLKGLTEADQAVKSGIPYGDAKLDTERLVMSFHNAGRLTCTIVRPANVTGPGSVWVKDIIDKMSAMPMALIDNGMHSASLIYVDNLADGIIMAGTQDIAKGKTYLLRDDWDVTWGQYISDLGCLIEKKPAGSIPYGLARIAGSILDAFCTPLRLRPPVSRMSVEIVGRNNDVDTSLARRELGWKTRVSYPEAMKVIGAWVLKTYTRT